MTTKQWFALMTIFAFISVISFFQIDSYWAAGNRMFIQGIEKLNRQG